MAFEIIDTINPTTSLAAGFDIINDNFALISSTANTEGASLVGIEDTAGKFDTNTVEGALNELTLTTAGNGAAIIGIQDTAGKFDTNTVEGALNELTLATTGNGAAIIGFADSGANYDANTVEAAFTELASTSLGQGASIIGINNITGKYGSANVEDAFTELTSTSTGDGSAIIGIEDAGGYYTGAAAQTVEGALQELGSVDGAAIIGITDTGGYFPGASNVEDALQILGLGGGGGGSLHPGTIEGVASLNYTAIGSNSIEIPTNSGSIRLHTFTDCYIAFGDATVTADGIVGIPFLAGTEILGVPSGATHIAISGMVTGATANITGLDQAVSMSTGDTIQVYYGAGSSRIAKPDTVADFIRIYNPTGCYINYGDSTVTSSSTTGMYLEAGIETLHVNPAITHIAISKYMVEGTAYITGMD